MNDSISRQAAIELCDWYEHEFCECDYAIKALADDLKSLSTIEPRKGHWSIEDCHAATYKYCCSECNAHHRARYDYCPTCGADMREESEETTNG